MFRQVTIFPAGCFSQIMIPHTVTFMTASSSFVQMLQDVIPHSGRKCSEGPRGRAGYTLRRAAIARNHRKPDDMADFLPSNVAFIVRQHYAGTHKSPGRGSQSSIIRFVRCNIAFAPLPNRLPSCQLSPLA